MTPSEAIRPRTARMPRPRRYSNPAPVLIATFLFIVVVFGLLLGLGRSLLVLVPVFIAGIGAFLAMRRLLRESFRAGRDLPETGELRYGFAGHEIHAFVAAGGAVWLRARDVRRILGLQRTDARMALAYPDGWRRAHPGSAAWFVSPETVRRHWGGSTRPEVNRFLHWLERELVPLGRARAGAEAAARANGSLAQEERGGAAGYLVRFWRGEHGLAHVFGAGAAMLLVAWQVSAFDPDPAAVTLHYRRYAAILLMALAGGTLLAAWWGVGAWRSARRWLAADRSLLVGAVVAMAGMTLIGSAFDRLGSLDHNMTLFTLARMAADAEPKPEVRVEPGGRLLLSGEMGFGTTNRVRAALARDPGIREVELDSPGGSAMEGFVLAALVRDRGLDTRVRASCASACVLVFAGGRERVAEPGARFGLHRAGVDWRKDGAVSETDLRTAAWFRERGVGEEFIGRVLATPFHEIWEPTLREVFASGLANSRNDTGGSSGSGSSLRAN